MAVARGEVVVTPSEARGRQWVVSMVVALSLAACAGAHTTAIAPSAFAFKVDSFRAAPVQKGASHIFVYSSVGPWAIHVLDVSRLSCNKVVAVKGAMSAVGRVKTSEMLLGLSRQRVVIGGVNADFFALSNGVPTNLLVMGGHVMTPPSVQPVFAMDSAGKPHILTYASIGDAFAPDDPALRSVSLAPFHPLEAVGGRPRLLRDSVIVPDVDTVGGPGFAKGRHPRTAIGIADNGRRLLFVVVDGRRAAYSDGMTLRELATLMLALGARDALNLDGGGSTTMVIGDAKTRTLEIVNRPSDPQGERAVGDALAIVRAC